MRIYLDNCCFNRPYDDQESEIIALESKAKTQIQYKIKLKKISLAWSFMLDYENSANSSNAKREEIKNWSKISNLIVEPKEEIFKIAEELSELGVKKKDSIHIACAIYGKCEIFITVDKGILKRANHIEKIKILNPIEFLYFLEDES
jgi:predicted nucleic acid-binding protein